MHRVPVLLLLAGVLVAGEYDLAQDGKSPRARQYRVKAEKAWSRAAPTAELARTNKPVTPEAAVAAVAAIEEAVLHFERSLEKQWNQDVNRALTDAVKAWFNLRPHLPPRPEPKDEAEAKKLASAQKKERTMRLRGARRFVMDYGKARRYASQFQRCRKCEGRKDIRGPFGGAKQPCTMCARQGIQPVRKTIIEARWQVYSPMYRADARNERQVTRALRQAGSRPRSLGPFVQSVAIEEVEDHDTWVRIRTKEKTHAEPHSKRVERGQGTYTLFRVGKTWYLYEERWDREVIEIPAEEEEEVRK